MSHQWGCTSIYRPLSYRFKSLGKRSINQYLDDCCPSATELDSGSVRWMVSVMVSLAAWSLELDLDYIDLTVKRHKGPVVALGKFTFRFKSWDSFKLFFEPFSAPSTTLPPVAIGVSARIC